MTIQREDLEAKLREIESIVEETKVQVKNTGVVLALATVVTIALAFVVGKKRGKQAGGARVEVFRLK